MDQTGTLVRRLARMAAGALARHVRRLADAVLEATDPPPRDPLGPPAHWVEKVRHAAPELLLPLPPRRSRLRTSAPPPPEGAVRRPTVPDASTHIPSPRPETPTTPTSLGLGPVFAGAPVRGAAPAVRWSVPPARPLSAPRTPPTSTTPIAHEPGPRFALSPTRPSVPGPKMSPAAGDPRDRRASSPRGDALTGVDPPAATLPLPPRSPRPAFAPLPPIASEVSRGWPAPGPAPAVETRPVGPPLALLPLEAHVDWADPVVNTTSEARATIPTWEPSPPVPFVAPEKEDHNWPALPASPGPSVDAVDEADPWRRAQRVERELRGG